MGDQRCHLGLFLSPHQDGHEVVNLIHVHVAPVVTADQHLDTEHTKKNKDVVMEARPRREVLTFTNQWLLRKNKSPERRGFLLLEATDEN